MKYPDINSFGPSEPEDSDGQVEEEERIANQLKIFEQDIGSTEGIFAEFFLDYIGDNIETGNDEVCEEFGAALGDIYFESHCKKMQSMIREAMEHKAKKLI